MTFIELIDPINDYLKTNQVPPLTDSEVHYWLNQYKELASLELASVVESILNRRQGRIVNTPLPRDGSIGFNASNFTFKWGVGVDFWCLV